MRRPSVAPPMLLAAFILLCVCVLAYELVDLFHVSTYVCGGRRYATLPDLTGGTCRRLWGDWTLTPTGPRALGDGLAIVAIVVLAALAAASWSLRWTSPPWAVLLVVSSIACIGVVGYEAMDALYASRYVCDGGYDVYLTVPNVYGGTCHRRWDAWAFQQSGPVTPGVFVGIAGVIGFFVVAAAAISAATWRQKQIDWLLAAVVEQTNRLVLRTQFEFYGLLIQASKDALQEVGSQLLVALTDARKSVIVDENPADAAAKMALVHHEVVMARRDSFIQSRVNARRVVAASMAIISGNFSEAWHEVVYAWHGYVNTQQFVPEMVLLAKLTGLPSNPHSPTFKEELDAAVEREKWGFSMATYLNVLVPLQVALSRHNWVNEVMITVEVQVPDPRRAGKTKSETHTLKGKVAIDVMRAFLAQPLPWSKDDLPKSA